MQNKKNALQAGVKIWFIIGRHFLINLIKIRNKKNKTHIGRLFWYTWQGIKTLDIELILTVKKSLFFCSTLI
jgi:hypothetical protein